MKSFGLVGSYALLLAVPALFAQQEHSPTAVRVVEFDDGMSSWSYALARGSVGPIVNITDDGISFGRDPLLVFVCMGGEVAVVYRFDSELFRGDEGVFVRYRLGEQSPSERVAWLHVPDPVFAAQFEVGIAALGADSANPFLQMYATTSTATRMPSGQTAGFLEAATEATEVTLRVTDAMDGETFTDVFSLIGLTEAIGAVKRQCQ
jgi:hypothetical protein